MVGDLEERLACPTECRNTPGTIETSFVEIILPRDELDALYRALVNNKKHVRLTREHFRYDNTHNHNNVLKQHRYNDLNR
nr:hypothetical protein BaRGS_012968 [Batillaria attramentaria]